MSKFWHIMASVGGLALVAVAPQLQTIIAGHAIVTTVLGAAWAVLGNLLPSPTAKPGM